MKQNKLFWLHLLLAYTLAFVNGFRMPNLWSINYFLPRFFDGFYRRSLAGTLLYFIGDVRFRYLSIAAIQFTIFIILNLVIVREAYKSGRRFRYIFLLFLLGPAGGYLFHEIGYIDQLLFLVLFLACAVKRRIFGAGLIISSMWLHEMALFTIAPLYIYYLLINRRSLTELVVVGIGSLVSFCVIFFFFQTVQSDRLNYFISQVAWLSDYPIRRDYYDIFSNQIIGIRQRLYYNLDSFFTILLIIPLLITVGQTSALTREYSIEKRILFLSGFLVPGFPLLLGFFGWDTSRWFFISIASATCCLFYLRNYIYGTRIESILVIYTALAVLLRLDYFDGYVPRLHSFTDSIDFVRNIFSFASKTPSI